MQTHTSEEQTSDLCGLMVVFVMHYTTSSTLRQTVMMGDNRKYEAINKWGVTGKLKMLIVVIIYVCAERGLFLDNSFSSQNCSDGTIKVNQAPLGH